MADLGAPVRVSPLIKVRRVLWDTENVALKEFSVVLKCFYVALNYVILQEMFSGTLARFSIAIIQN